MFGCLYRYDGNPFLCLSSNETCASSYTPSPSPSEPYSPSKVSLGSALPLIFGLAIGAAAVCVAISILITCIICKKRTKQYPSLITSSKKNELENHFASTAHDAANSHGQTEM